MTLYRIAVTGHRDLGDEKTIQFVRDTFHIILNQTQHNNPAGVVALSGLAEGSDTLFAETALMLDVSLEAVIAYQGFAQDFPPGPRQERYLNLLSRCQTVHQLPFRWHSKNAYMAVGHWLVEHCDLLIAAWDGQPARGRGGTGDVVAYAQQCNKPVCHIHTQQRNVMVVSSDVDGLKHSLQEVIDGT